MSKFQGSVRDLGEVPRDMLAAVQTKLRANDHLWISEDPRFQMAHSDSQHIIFKFPQRYPQSHLGARYTELWQDWRVLLSPIIDLARARYEYGEGETSKIMLSKLRAKGSIPTHVDSSPSSLVPHKVHVPLETNEGVIFVIGGTRHHLAVGKAYEINNLLPHSVENNSDTDRVHLIFELYQVDDRTTSTA
jgi:hypothetical protein